VSNQLIQNLAWALCIIFKPRYTLTGKGPHDTRFPKVLVACLIFNAPLVTSHKTLRQTANAPLTSRRDISKTVDNSVSTFPEHRCVCVCFLLGKRKMPCLCLNALDFSFSIQHERKYLKMSANNFLKAISELELRMRCELRWTIISSTARSATSSKGPTGRPLAKPTQIRSISFQKLFHRSTTP
jgi:hypothetical protein